MIYLSAIQRTEPIMNLLRPIAMAVILFWALNSEAANEEKSSAAQHSAETKNISE